MPEETLSEKLQGIIDNDVHEFMGEVFESSLPMSLKGRVAVDVQYSIERLELAVRKLQGAEA